SHERSALAHAGKTMMSIAVACVEDVWFDSFSVVADEHPESALLIMDFHLDLSGLRVRKAIASRFAGDAIDFVPAQGRQIARFAVAAYTKLRTSLHLAAQLHAECADRLGEVVGEHRGGAQSLDCLSTLGNSPASVPDGGLYSFFGFLRAGPDQPCRGMKFQQGPLKALQQGIVQIPRDASPFRYSLFQTEVAWSRNLTHPIGVGSIH